MLTRELLLPILYSSICPSLYVTVGRAPSAQGTFREWQCGLQDAGLALATICGQVSTFSYYSSLRLHFEYRHCFDRSPRGLGSSVGSRAVLTTSGHRKPSFAIDCGAAPASSITVTGKYAAKRRSWQLANLVSKTRSWPDCRLVALTAGCCGRSIFMSPCGKRSVRVAAQRTGGHSDNRRVWIARR